MTTDLPVPPSGPAHAKIAIVGEAPGADEVRLGEPFVGSSGKLLNQMLESAGISRRDCYLTNVSKVRPRGNDFKSRFYDKGVPTQELSRCWYVLMEELHQVSPSITVLLGAEALRAVTGRKGITDWRGSLQWSTIGKTLATLHPAYVLRMYASRRIVEHDLRRALEESRSPRLLLPQHNFLPDPSYLDVCETLNMVLQGKFKVAFDIETLGPRVRCLGFAWNRQEAICIPFTSCRRPPGDSEVASTHVPAPTDTPFHSHWTEGEEAVILGLCNDILSNPSIPLIAQNFPFDASYLEREFGIVCRGLQMDTMVAQHCCYSELPKSLNFLCSFYTRVPCYWQYNASSDLETWKYNCYDCAVTFEVAEALEKELAELEGRTQ